MNSHLHAHLFELEAHALLKQPTATFQRIMVRSRSAWALGALVRTLADTSGALDAFHAPFKIREVFVVGSPVHHMNIK